MKKDARYALFKENQQFKIAIREYQRQAKRDCQSSCERIFRELRSSSKTRKRTKILHCAHQTLRGLTLTEDKTPSQIMSPNANTHSMNRRKKLMRNGHVQHFRYLQMMFTTPWKSQVRRHCKWNMLAKESNAIALYVKEEMKTLPCE